MSDSKLLEPGTHAIKVDNAGLSTLHDALNAPGWAGGEKEFKAARRARRALPAVIGDGAAHVHEFTIKEKERDTCKKCLQHFLDSKAFKNNDVAYDLLIAFAVIEADKDD